MDNLPQRNHRRTVRDTVRGRLLCACFSTRHHQDEAHRQAPLSAQACAVGCTVLRSSMVPGCDGANGCPLIMTVDVSSRAYSATPSSDLTCGAPSGASRQGARPTHSAETTPLRQRATSPRRRHAARAWPMPSSKCARALLTRWSPTCIQVGASPKGVLRCPALTRSLSSMRLQHCSSRCFPIHRDPTVTSAARSPTASTQRRPPRGRAQPGERIKDTSLPAPYTLYQKSARSGLISRAVSHVRFSDRDMACVWRYQPCSVERGRRSAASELRAPYAMSGTDGAYHGTSWRPYSAERFRYTL